MTAPGFTPVLLALPSLTPSVAVEVLPRGLTFHKIYVQVDGKTHDIVIGPEDASDFESPSHKYHNTIVGRYSNRLPVGTHELSRNGITSQLVTKANEGDTVNLHGGPIGFDTVDWEPIDPFAATLFSNKEKESLGSIPSAAVFRHISEDGDQGFPGKLLIEVLVGLVNPGHTNVPLPKHTYDLGSIVLVYRAKLLDEKPTVTPVNLTQHWGFNLEGIQQEGQSISVKDHHLTIKAGNTIDLSNVFLSTGKLNPVQGTEHHHEKKLIGEKFPNPGYDSFYVFDRTPSVIPTRVSLDTFDTLDLIQEVVNPSNTTATSVVELTSEKSGLKLTFESNQSGVQFYSGNFVGKEGARKKIHGGTGKINSDDGYGGGCAAFLEFHEPLAAWLHPETTPSANDTLITNGELYNNFVKVNVTFHSPGAL